MEKMSTILYGVVSILVVVILIATVCIPVIESSRSEHTEANNTSAIYTMLETTDDVLIEINTTTGALSVDGVVQDIDFTSADYSKIWGDTFTARASKSAENVYSLAVQKSGSVISVKSISYENGTITFTKLDDTTTTLESAFILYPDSKGNYAEYKLIDSDIRKNVYVNYDSEIIIGLGGYGYDLFRGKYNDLEAIGLTPESNSVNIQIEDAYEDLSFRFAAAPTINHNGSDTNDVLVYVPIKYDMYTEQQAMIRALLYILPVILCVIPLMVAVRLITNGRD